MCVCVFLQATGKMDENSCSRDKHKCCQDFQSVSSQGRISVGSDSDLVIWDPDAVKIVSAKNHQSVWPEWVGVE